MRTTSMFAAIDALITIINTGDVQHARDWAADNADALSALRVDVAARTKVATACVAWGAPMVWPWGDRPALNAADKRVLSAIRRGAAWRGSEDTVNRLLAYGEICKSADGRLVAA